MRLPLTQPELKARILEIQLWHSARVVADKQFGVVRVDLGKVVSNPGSTRLAVRWFGITSHNDAPYDMQGELNRKDLLAPEVTVSPVVRSRPASRKPTGVEEQGDRMGGDDLALKASPQIRAMTMRRSSAVGSRRSSALLASPPIGGGASRKPSSAVASRNGSPAMQGVWSPEVPMNNLQLDAALGDENEEEEGWASASVGAPKNATRGTRGSVTASHIRMRIKGARCVSSSSIFFVNCHSLPLKS